MGSQDIKPNNEISQQENSLEKNAGFVIIMSEVFATYERFGKAVDHRIVLGEKETKHGKEYVTWVCSGCDYYWGHYFADKTLALIDYHKRLIGAYRPEE